MKLKDFFINNLIVPLKVFFHQQYLSLTSVDFYYSVYKNYNGYGIKLLFTAALLSSALLSLLILAEVGNIRDYFIYNRASSKGFYIDYLVNQLPDIDYDGQSINISRDEPTYLYDNDSNEIVAIDTQGKIPYTKRQNIPILFTEKNLVVSMIGVSDDKQLTIPIPYTNSLLFGNAVKVWSKDDIRTQLANIFNNVILVFDYLVFPLLVATRFVSVLFEKTFIVAAVYFILIMIGEKASVKSSLRLALFASIVPIFIVPILSYYSTVIANSINIMLQIWCNLLLLLAILKIKKIREIQ